MRSTSPPVPRHRLPGTPAVGRSIGPVVPPRYGFAVVTKAPRRSRAELRQLVVDAGLAILAEDGLRMGADLTFKRVFERVEADTGIRLTNASIIRRVWADQAAFQSAIMATVVTDFDEAGQMETSLELLVPLLASFDRSTPESRWEAVLEFGRIATEVAIGSRVGHRGWELFIGVWVVSVTNPQAKEDKQLRRALTEGMDATGAAWTKLVGAIHGYLGVRVREGLTLEQHCESAAAMAAGFALRQASRDERQVHMMPTGPGGELREWTLFGIALEGLALKYLELIPDWQPPD